MKFLGINKFPVTLFSLIGFSFLFNAYHYTFEGEGLKIVWLKTILNPNLYLHDLVSGLRSSYLSCIFYITVPLQVLLGSKLAWAVLYTFSKLIFFISVYLITFRLTRKRVVAIFAVALLVIPKMAPGGITTFDAFFHERLLAFSLILFGVYLMSLDRHGWAGTLLGLSGSLHIPTLINVLPFVFFYYLISENFEKRPKLFEKIGPFTVWMGVGLIPLMERLLTQGFKNVLTRMDEGWLGSLLLYNPQALHPGMESALMFVAMSTLLLGILIVFKVFRTEDVRYLGVAYLASFLGLLSGYAIAFVNAKIYTLQLFSILNPLQTARIHLIFSCIVTAYIFYHFFGRRRSLAVFFVVCFICLKPLLKMGVLLAIFIYGLISLRVGLVQKLNSRLGFIQTTMGNTRLWHLMLTLIFVSTLLVFLGYRDDFENPFSQDKNANIQIQEWIKENTMRGDIILAPPYENDFRIHSERSSLGTWHDLWLAVLDRDFALQMGERLKDFCGISAGQCSGEGCLDQCQTYYTSLRSHEIERLHMKHHFRYLVMPVENPLSFEEVVRNEEYVVYEISRYADETMRHKRMKRNDEL